MDGRKPRLRNLLIAALALAGQPALVQADDFIRQPARPNPQSARAGNQGHQAAPSGADSGRSPSVASTEPSGRTKASLVSTSQPVPSQERQSQTRQSQGAQSQQPQSQLPEAPPRGQLAARISNELLANRVPTGPRANVTAASSLESGPGWQAVGEELREHVNSCERLLARSANLSAMEEARRGIVRLVRVLDLRQNKLTSEPAWAQAQQALREALEFTTHERIANDADLFTRIIQSHETPALHGAEVVELTPLAAAQHYRAYAEKCLVEASQGHPWFGELYYCMGRALEAQAHKGSPQADALLQEALTYYRSAHAIQPSNPTNTNQLAYVLLRMDRPAEALVQLGQAVRQPDCPLEAWQNLVEASSRVNDHRTEQWALQNYTALKQQGVVSAGQTGTLVEVDPRQFAAMSPYTSGPQFQASSASQPASQSASPPANPSTAPPASTPRTAAAPKAGFFR